MTGNHSDAIVPRKGETEIAPFKTAQGDEWHVFVSAGGTFRAVAEGFSAVTSDTLESVRNQARVKSSTSRVKVEVPFAYLQVTGSPARGNLRHEWVHGIATGLHSANGNVLYRIGSKTGQIDSWSASRSTHIEPPTTEDADRIAWLTIQISKLQDELRELNENYMFSDGLGSAVRQAIAEAMAERGEK